MCGIAGFITRNGHADAQRIPAVLDQLRHRGPDDQGYLCFAAGKVETRRTGAPFIENPEVILLHRRLAIIDLTENGWQPMSSRDGRYHIVFNGEIYNYIELKDELCALGHVFVTHSDTEVLMEAIKQWGADALGRLVGMFAFALLDTLERRLFLARDFFGIKPLYFRITNGCFAFASELKVLAELSPGTLQVNPERLLLYLRHGTGDYGTSTLFADIQQLPPAHYMSVSLDDFTHQEPVRYWKPAADPIDVSFDEAASRVRELFLNNIRLHLRSDVPLGAALSGGIDSGSIVMAMRHVDSRADIHAISYVADDSKISEEKWIDEIGRASGAHVHKVHPQATDLAEDFEFLTYFQDEPFGSTSLYSQFCVFRAARAAGITVMLDGQGGDEIFGGYRYYMGARLASLIKQGKWIQAVRFLDHCRRLPQAGALMLALSAADYLLPQSLQGPFRRMVGKDLLPPWLNRKWFTSRGIHPDGLRRSRTSHVLTESLFADLTEYSLPHLLRYEDRNSMAFSIESRVPFLTPELVNYVVSLPEEYIISPDGTSKAVFRRAMRGIVPDAILDRRDKIGFATPELAWLDILDPWVRRILGSEAARGIPFLNIAYVNAEWDLVRRGREPFDSRVWRWLNIIRWTQQFGIRYDQAS